MRAGELILLPRNDEHVFGSDVSLPFTPAHELIQASAGGGMMRVRAGGGGAATQILCGFLGSDIAFTPLLSALPPLMKLEMPGSASGAWIESSFRFAVSEIASGRMGSATVIAKLSELLFIEAIGQYVAGLPSERKGWFAGLCDAQIGRALALLHENPKQVWTTEELAAQVGMSRSVLAERFTVLVGDSPMHYLAKWRMYVAAQQLRDGSHSVAQVAFAVGYDSEAAFSRAFKRQFGESPEAWRRQYVARRSCRNPCSVSAQAEDHGSTVAAGRCVGARDLGSSALQGSVLRTPQYRPCLCGWRPRRPCPPLVLHPAGLRNRERRAPRCAGRARSRPA